jgi:predicted transposase/invertase (TIGR01784 family)
LYGWARFIAAETEEELEMAVQANPQVRKAAVKLRELSADEKARDMLERREKGLWDMATSVAEAEQRGREEKALEVARNLLKRNTPIEQIVELTGLTREEVEALSKQQG